MASVADPVAFGLAQSLSHPGGNLTGLGNFADVLASKQLDLLRELMPRLSRVAVLVNASNPLHAPQIAATRDAVQSTQAVLLTVEIRSPHSSTTPLRPLREGGPKGSWCRRTRCFARTVNGLPSWLQLPACLRSMAIATTSRPAA